MLGLAAGLVWRLHRALRLARFEATHDDTTGLPNRRALHAHLHRVLAAARPTGLVLLDLDRFKTINDTHGHDTGNAVLTEVGHRLAGLVHPVSLVARLSGDEFVLVVDGHPGDVQAVAHAAATAIAATPVEVGDNLRLPVRASVGYAYARPGTSARWLLAAADEAMYRAKAPGRPTSNPAPGRRVDPDPGHPRRRRDRHPR